MQYKITIFLLTLFCGYKSCYCAEKDLLPALPTQEALLSSLIYNSVNVITGEYCEAQTDLIVNSTVPIAIRRCYTSLDPHSKRWHFNHPNIQTPDNLYPLDDHIKNQQIHYEYDAQLRLIAIKAVGENDGKQLGHINIVYEDGDLPTCLMTGSNGQFVQYQFCKHDSSRSGLYYLLQKAQFSNAPFSSYEYQEHPTERKMLITKREQPDGRYGLMEYYQGGDNDVGDLTVRIDDSSRDFRVGRVKLQRGPCGVDATPLTTQRFVYYDGYTEVYDALDNKTIFRYSTERRLTAVEHYCGQQLYRAENYFWDVADGDHQQLISKVMKDSQGAVLSCQTFEYDSRGLMTRETLYGDLTGKGQVDIIIDEKGKPIENGVESFSKKYVYSGDEIPVILSIHEDGGKAIHYRYDAGKLKSKFFYDRERIQSRYFYFYDHEGFLIKTIHDDGSNEDDCLTGVCERFITRYQLGQQSCNYGLPVVCEESYWDSDSSSEKVIKQTHHLYSQQGLLIKQEVFDGNNELIDTLINTYNDCGQFVSCCSNEKNGIYSYDANGLKKSAIENNKNEKSKTSCFVYDFSNRLIRLEEQDCQGNSIITTYAYDTVGNKIAATDTFGNTTEYEYDPFGRVIAIIHPSVLDANDQIVTPIEKREYDIFNRITTSIDACGYVTTYRYNARGKPVAIVHPDGTQEKFEYTLQGQLAKMVARNGTCAIYQTDDQGRATKVELLTTEGAVYQTTSATYNAFHMISATDPLGYTTFYEYDGAGRQIRVTKPTGEGLCQVQYQHDAIGDICSKKEWFGINACEYTNFITERDASQRIQELRIESADGNILRKNSFEHQGQEDIDLSNEQQKNVWYNYNFFNDHGQNVLQTSVVNSSGIITVSTFDALGRLASMIQKNKANLVLCHQEIRYDLNGNKVRQVYHLTDSDGSKKTIVNTWKYGPEKRLEECIEAKGSSKQKRTCYLYDAWGQLQSIVKPNGVALNRTYTPEGQLETLSATDNSLFYIYKYDASGNVVEVVDAINGGVTTRQYNAHKKVVAETLGNGLSLLNYYDLQGRRQQLTLPDNSAIQYVFDAAYLKQIDRVTDSSQLLYSHIYKEYSPSGTLLSSSLIGDLGDLAFTYDDQGRKKAITCPYWSEYIEYDSIGNVKQAIFQEGKHTRTHQYEYDLKSQLTRESGSFNNTYGYDSAHNRIAKNDDEGEVNDLNELIRMGDSHHCYDANGLLVNKKIGGLTVFYTYDALNRLKEIINHNTAVLYTYDAFGRRLSKTIRQWDDDTGKWMDCKTLRFLYDGDLEIGAVDASGAIVELRVLGTGLGADIGAAVAIELNGAVFAPVHDHMGSVSCLIALDERTMSESYTYSAYGEVQMRDKNKKKIDDSYLNNPWGYCSKRKDPETDWLFFGKRHYDTRNGRWTTPDPLGFADGMNRYAYVLNNPLNRLDLYGLWSFADLWNTTINAIKTMMDSISSLARQANTFVNNLSLINYLKGSHEGCLEGLLGKTYLCFAGYYNESAETGVFINGDQHSKVRITAINGLFNLKEDLIYSTEMIAISHNASIHYVFRPSKGWTLDILKSSLIKFGFVSTPARQLAALWKKLISEMGGPGQGGLIIHYAHSLGGSDTYIARELLTPEEQGMIRVITVGTASFIPNVGFESVVNYVSVRDGVSFTDPIGYIHSLIAKDTNVVFIGSLYGIPFIDHLLTQDTYKGLIQFLGEKFREEFAAA